MVVSTNPNGNAPTTTTTTSKAPTSTTSTTSEPNTDTHTEINNPQNEGTAPSGNYPDDDQADNAIVGYTLVDLANGNALLTQNLSLDGLLATLGDNYSNYSILAGSEITLRISLSALDDNGSGVPDTTYPDSVYTMNNSTVSI